MPIEVEAPGGVVIEFPDGMSQDEILAVMRQKFPPQGSVSQPSQSSAPPAPDGSSAVGRILSRGATRAGEAFDTEANPLGLDPKTIQALRDAGVFTKKPGAGFLEDPIRFVNEALLKPVGDVLEVGVRGIDAGVRGVAGLAGQTSRELGQSQGMAKRLERDVENLATAGGIAAGGAPSVTVPRTLRAPSARQTTAQRLAQRRLGEVQGFRDAGVAPFGPGLAEVGTANIANATARVPGVGIPMSRRIRGVFDEAEDSVSSASAGQGTARSLDEASASTFEGIQAWAGPKSPQLRQQNLDRLDDVAASQVINDTLRAPQGSVPYRDRLAAYFERAWRSIPEDMRAGRSVTDEPRLLSGVTNTRDVVRDMVRRRIRAASAGDLPTNAQFQNHENFTQFLPVRGGLLGQMLAQMTTGRWRGGLQTVRDVRSEVRRLASGFADTQKNTLSNAELGQIQSALTRDMAELLSRNGHHVAAHRFRQADRFTRMTADRAEALKKIIGADDPEVAANVLFQAARAGSKGSIRKLVAARRAVTNEVWGDLRAGIIHHIAQPRHGSQESAQGGISLNSFLTNWNKMSSASKNVVFGRGNDPLRRQLDGLAQVAATMRRFEGAGNPSGTAHMLYNLALGGSLITGGQTALTAGGLLAANMATARILSSQAYVRWLTRALRSQQRGTWSTEWPQRLAALRLLGEQDAETREEINQRADQIEAWMKSGEAAPSQDRASAQSLMKTLRSGDGNQLSEFVKSADPTQLLSTIDGLITAKEQQLAKAKGKG